MEFAEKVRSLLKSLRLSQADLAEAIGTNQPQVSRWLDSNTPPKWAYLLKMARTLDVSVDYLIDPAQVAPPRASELTEDERFLLRSFRALKIDADTAVSRMSGHITIEQDVEGMRKLMEEKEREKGGEAKRLKKSS